MNLEDARGKFAHPGNEAAVLSCILKDPSNYFEVEARLSDKDFLTARHRALWTVIKSLVKQDVIIFDTSTLLNQALALNVEKTIGSNSITAYDYISALFDKSLDSSNIDFYLTRMSDSSTKLKIIQASDEINELVERNKTLTGETLTADTIVENAQEKFLQISVDRTKEADAINVADGVEELLEEIRLSPTHVRGIPTGFNLLDAAINGLEPGTLTVLGARPKTGKSTILMNWAKHMAYETGNSVLYIDTEMSTREQQFRLLSLLSSVKEREIKNGIYLQDEQNIDRVREAHDIMNRGSIMHKYYPNFTPEGVAALARKYHHQGKVQCLVFDYIKLPDADLQMMGNVKEYQALGYLCVALKNLAGQLGIPVVTAVQLNREGANKSHVSSSNFADSDRILRYANTLLGLTIKTKQEQQEVEEQYGRDQALNLGTHRLQILDTRSGGTNYDGIDVYFRQETLTMYEAEEQLFRLQQPMGGGHGLE